MFTQILGSDGMVVSLHCSTHDHYIPLDPNNNDYQAVLDAIIDKGSSAFEGDIPTDLQKAADAKLFANQLAEYKLATARLEQYQVAQGRDEVKETRNTGRKIWDEDKEEWVNETEELITQTRIDPVEPTVKRLVVKDFLSDPTEETIDNPLITKDKAERAGAEATVSATPQAVKDAA